MIHLREVLISLNTFASLYAIGIRLKKAEIELRGMSRSEIGLLTLYSFPRIPPFYVIIVLFCLERNFLSIQEAMIYLAVLSKYPEVLKWTSPGQSIKFIQSLKEEN